MADHLSIAVMAARKAGEMLKANFGSIMNIEKKADRSLVTNLDKEAERIIVSDLLAAFPSYGIIGEEGGKSRGNGAYTWVIDPQEFASQIFNIRMSGSSVRYLTFCAEGKVDAVIEFDDRIWDFAAGVTIIREAGGKITGHQGGALDGTCGCYGATNGHLHNAVIEIVGKN